MNSSPPISRSLAQNPRIGQWIDFDSDDAFRLKTGKVEIGQGILTALVQIAAEELRVRPDQIRIQESTTADSPNEMFTAGSQSIETSGAAIRAACADIRETCLDHIAQTYQSDRNKIAIVEGHFEGPNLPEKLTYFSLRRDITLDRPVRTDMVPSASVERSIVGTSLPRLDLLSKMTGAAFIHDLTFENTLHARIVRRPEPDARLDEASLNDAKRVLLDDTDLVVRGNFIAVCAKDESLAVKSAERVAQRLRWSGLRSHDDTETRPEKLKSLHSMDRTVEASGETSGRNAVSQVTSTYRRPYLAHGSIGPCCAIAHWDGEHLTVWSHTQGVYPLRDALAKVFDLSPEKIVVQHRQGAGCYGHNGADDVACDAALIAMARQGHHIRVQWSRKDELSAAPYGAASVVEINAGVDHEGRPTSWDIEIWSPTHNQRPTSRGGAGLLAAYDIEPPQPPMEPGDVPDDNGSGGSRNAFALYDLPTQRLTHHLITDPPLRTSALRGLGAHANVFANESFIDELSERAGVDPVAYRLALLSDVRARRVLEAVADMAAKEPSDAAGRGFAFSRYKNKAAYVAIAADVDIDEEVRVRSIWCAVDAGLVINPDGVLNQVEGGILQSISWTLKERVQRNQDGHLPATWEDYPILKFSEVPDVKINLLSSDNETTLGVGEVAVGPTAAALGNAASRALGTRLRDLPLSREMIAELLLKA